MTSGTAEVLDRQNEFIGARLRRQQVTTLALLFLAGMVNFLDRASLSVANLSVRSEMHLSATQMGWLLSAFSLAYGLAQLPLVGMLDRIGTRSALGVGLLVWSAAQLLTGFVRGLSSFLWLRVLLGTGEAPFYPAGMRSVREWFRTGTRGRATAIINTSQAIGLAIAPPLLTWIMLRAGWRAMFMLLGLIGIVIAVAWMWLYRERSASPAMNLQQAGAVDTASAWKLLMTQRTAWGMMLGWGGVNYTVWLYVAWLPGYLQEQRHLSLVKSGWIAALPFIAGGLGMLTSGFCSDKLARRGIALTSIHRGNLVVGMVISAASTLFVARASTTFEAVAGISFALYSVHFAGTSGWGYVQSVTSLRYVAPLGALQNFASFMIASAAPVVTGWLLDRTHSFVLALGLCSTITLLGALSYATLAAPSGMRLTDSPE